METVLYITTEPLERIPEESARELAGRQVRFLDLSDAGAETELPAGWERLAARDYFDPDAFRRDFVSFLEEWPKKPIWKDKSFDDLFRLPSGYSLWWTTVGAERTPRHTPVPELRALWVLDRAIQDRRPERTIIHSRDEKLAAVLASRCSRDAIPVDWQRRSTSSSGDTPLVSVAWVLWQLLKLPLRTLQILFQAASIRLLSGTPRESKHERTRPAIFFGTNVAREVSVRSGAPSIPAWDDLREELRRRFPDLRHKILFFPGIKGLTHWKYISWIRRTGSRLQREIGSALRYPESYAGLRTWSTALPRQISCLLRLVRVARSPEFSNSFLFSGADVLPLFGRRIREAVGRMAEWERKVACYAHTFRGIGNLKVVLNRAEFYRVSLPIIAAAHRLGVPVVAVEHGTIMPMNFAYTVPQGHVNGAPIPEYFAAYGDYARTIVSELGAYPSDRVWLTGASRLDHLVNRPPDPVRARQLLDLPLDRKIVLVATQTYPWFAKVVDAVFDAVRNRTDCIVCIKMHFGDRGRAANYRASAERAGIRQARFFDNDFNELLAACDVLISASSTTLLEASLLGRSTICVNFSQEPDRYPYVAEGASLPARSPEELAGAVGTVLSGERRDELVARRDQFLVRHLGPTACGSGTHSLVSHLLPMIGEACQEHDSGADVPSGNESSPARQSEWARILDRQTATIGS